MAAYKQLQWDFYFPHVAFERLYLQRTMTYLDQQKFTNNYQSLCSFVAVAYLLECFSCFGNQRENVVQYSIISSNKFNESFMCKIIDFIIY